jgi:hypothetical protein
MLYQLKLWLSYHGCNIQTEEMSINKDQHGSIKQEIYFEMLVYLYYYNNTSLEMLARTKRVIYILCYYSIA